MPGGMRLMNNNYIKIDNNWFAKEDSDNLLIKYGHVGFMVYCILQKDVTVKNTIRFRIVDLIKDLQITINNSTMIKKIKDTLVQMNEKLFTICTDDNCNNSIDATKQLNNTTVYYLKLLTAPLEKKYFWLYNWEMNKIISIERDKRLGRGTLFTQMGYYAKSFGGAEKDKNENKLENYKIHYCTINAILKNCLTDDNTVIKNNKLLMENGIILYENPGMVKHDKNANNIYARVEDKTYFEDYVELQKSKIKIKYTAQKDKEQQNLQKSLKQKINNYKKLQGFDSDITIDDLTNKQIAILYELELAHYNLTINRGKKQKQPHYLTLHLDGTIKTKYVAEGETPKIDIDPQDGQPVLIEEPRGIINSLKQQNMMDNVRYVVHKTTHNKSQNMMIGGSL